MAVPGGDPGESVVEVAGLVKEYRSLFGRRRHRAVDGVSFAAGRGEVLGLLGPNGSGKTTTMKCLLGLLRPSAGAVRIFGRPPADLAVRARLGYLPEESPFPSFLRLDAALDFYARLARVPRRERRARVGALLERVGLGDARRRRISELSKGMLRRFGLAQALVGEPELLVLDEPTAGLDPLGTRDFRALLREQRARGATVVVSSHELAEVEQVCDRVALLHRGRLVAEGRLDALLAREGLPEPRASALETFFFRALGEPPP
jgi:ABC-2 type transport system ATP-binding protein